MKCKKLLALFMTVLMIMALFSACGGESMAYDANGAMTEEVYEMEAPEAAAPMPENGDLTSTSGSQTATPENEKIIITMHMDTETEDMDPLLELISGKVTQLGGYLEAQEIFNGSGRNTSRTRYAYLTIRIPADQLDSFVLHVEENSNIISQNTSTENVTLTYVGVESRIKALETEEARLLELLAKAENMDDLLKIEARLTEVQSELEQVKSTLRSLDNKINYSTIYLNITEVKEYTEVVEPETVGQRISAGFSKSLKNVGEGAVNLFVNFVVALPYLIPLAAVAGVVLLIIWLCLRKGKNKKKHSQEPPAKTE